MWRSVVVSCFEDATMHVLKHNHDNKGGRHTCLAVIKGHHRRELPCGDGEDEGSMVVYSVRKK
jgi:hypothetical protein